MLKSIWKRKASVSLSKLLSGMIICTADKPLGCLLRRVQYIYLRNNFKSLYLLPFQNLMLVRLHHVSPPPGKKKSKYWSYDQSCLLLQYRRLCGNLKGQCHEIFCFWFFSWISFPQAPEYTIMAVSNFFENSRRYSQLKVDHRYQRHRRQILPPVSLANLPPVSTVPAANNGINIRLQIPYYPKVSQQSY